MCLQRKTICDGCGKDADGLMRCFPLIGNEICLCPDCLEKDGRFCGACGEFCNNLIDGYCSDCNNEFESEDWDDLEYDDDWPDDEEEYDDDELYDNEIF